MLVFSRTRMTELALFASVLALTICSSASPQETNPVTENILARIISDSRKVFVHEESGALVLNRPGFRVFFQNGDVNFVCPGVEVEEAPYVVSGFEEQDIPALQDRRESLSQVIGDQVKWVMDHAGKTST